MTEVNMKKRSPDISASLTPRLLAISMAANGAKKMADIGTDHAYVPLYMVIKLGTSEAIAADINKGPLQRADANIKKYGLSDKIKTRQSDGLCEFKAEEADTIVIAGMGGTLIAKILEDSPQMKKEGIRFILQPMTAEEELRRYLSENGYKITDEKLSSEGEKLYTIITAEVGKSEPLSEAFCYVGKKLFENKDELFKLFLERKISEFEKVVKGLNKAAESDERNEKMLYYKSVLAEMKELKEECETW